MAVVQRLHHRVPPRPREVPLPGAGDERGRPVVETIRPALDLMSVLGVEQPVGGAPEPFPGHPDPPRRGRERLDRALPDGREQQGRVVVAGHEHQPVVAGGGERREGGDLLAVRREDPVQASQRLGLGAPQRRVVPGAGAVARLQQLERVAVQDEVGRAALLRQGGQEPLEVFRPPEVLVRRPRAVRRAPLAQAQVAHHHDPARRGVVALAVKRDRRHHDGEREKQANQPANRRRTAPLAARPGLHSGDRRREPAHPCHPTPPSPARAARSPRRCGRRRGGSRRRGATS